MCSESGPQTASRKQLSESRPSMPGTERANDETQRNEGGVWCGDGPAHSLLAHPGECAWKCRSDDISPPWSLDLQTHTRFTLYTYCAVVGAKPKD